MGRIWGAGAAWQLRRMSQMQTRPRACCCLCCTARHKVALGFDGIAARVSAVRLNIKAPASCGSPSAHVASPGRAGGRSCADP